MMCWLIKRLQKCTFIARPAIPVGAALTGGELWPLVRDHLKQLAQLNRQLTFTSSAVYFPYVTPFVSS
jgi:hypothetical protein